MNHLTRVTDATLPVLSRDEILELGNERFAAAREAVIAALHAGSVPGWFQRESLSIYDLERLRDAARSAAREWAKADAQITEVLNEVNRAKRASRIRPTSPGP